MSVSQLPTGWTTASLGEIVEILDRLRVPVNASERAHRHGTIPYYGATGQVGWIDSHIFDEELVLLGEDGAPFLQSDKSKAYIVRGKSWVNNHAHVLRGTIAISNGFLKHQLDQIDYRPFVSGTTRLKLPQGSMQQMTLRVAPTQEQQRIVSSIDSNLSKILAAIDGLRRVQANLKRYRASVLKAAVEGRLVPTEAELARREGRDYEPASVLLERILVERRRRWEEAELAKMKAKGQTPKDDKWQAKYPEPSAPDTDGLPDLPDGWCWASIEQIASDEPWSLAIGPFGSNLKVSDYRESGVPLVFVRNIRNKDFSLDNAKYIAFEKACELAAHAVNAGDVVVTKMGDPPGDACVYPTSVPVGVITADCIKIKTNPSVSAEYLVHCIHSGLVRRQIDGITKGVAQQKVSLSRFREIAIPLCSPQEQERIVLAVEQSETRAASVDANMAANLLRSHRLRQSILMWAFEGKLVDQDPTDEPASALLERIRAERESTPKPAKKSRKPAKKK